MFRGIGEKRENPEKCRGFPSFSGVRAESGYRVSSPLTCEVSLKPPQKWLLSSGFHKRHGVKGGSKRAWKRAITQHFTQHPRSRSTCRATALRKTPGPLPAHVTSRALRGSG